MHAKYDSITYITDMNTVGKSEALQLLAQRHCWRKGLHNLPHYMRPADQVTVVNPFILLGGQMWGGFTKLVPIVSTAMPGDRTSNLCIIIQVS